SDSGPGVAPVDKERIFARFARGGDNGRGDEGAGLGLAIVKAIAEAHQGKVEISETPGGGATFSIVLPTEAAAVRIIAEAGE
ncbi:MAG TPA: ATP-binding protein, partial [Egibacteraceae bacterium]|nr:ATP-binding protein [Egibacteraceae bacterium]